MNKSKKIIVTIIILFITFITGYVTSNTINQHSHYEEELWYDEVDINVAEEIKANREADIIVIPDNLYAEQCNDIDMYYGIYEGKTIEITGIYEQEDDSQCNYIGKIVQQDNEEEWFGFEFYTSDELPTPGEEITVKGTLGMYEENNDNFIALLDCSII